MASWKSSSFFRKSNVKKNNLLFFLLFIIIRIRFLPKIIPDKNESIEELSYRIRKVMLDELKKKPVIESSENFLHSVLFLLFLFIIYFCCCKFYKYFI